MDNNILQKVGIMAAVIYVAAYAYRVNELRLKYFSPAEFGAWFPLMNSDLLSKLDQFRGYMRVPVLISPATGAMGRFSRQESQHFPQPFVNAIDVMIPGATMSQILDGARVIGFHGIGLYPDWRPHHGVHLDMRADRTAENPALWSAIKTANGQQYVEIERALV